MENFHLEINQRRVKKMIQRIFKRILVYTVSLIFYAPITSYADYFIDGSFDTSSPVYNRTKSTPVTPAAQCTVSSEDSFNDNVPYAAYKIVPITSGTFHAYITPGSTTIDTLLALYCGSFDPENPEQNLIAMDDDSVGYPNAGLLSYHRAIPVVGGSTYYLVVTTYADYLQYGDYRLQIVDTFQHIHSLEDVIVALQVLAGLQPANSQIGHLSDIMEEGKVSIGTTIRAMQELTGGP